LEQRLDQCSEQRRRPGFQPGQSGNPTGRRSNAARAAAREAKARELTAELGGYDALSPIDKELALQVAGLALRKPRSAEDVVRHANAVDRILRGLSRRRGRRPERRALASFLEAPQG
jgi:hypothetical protein